MKYTLLQNGIAPTVGSPGSAGIDFYLPDNYPGEYLEPGESIKIELGVKVIIPQGKVGIFFNRSSIGSQGVILGACVIDSDYRGQLIVNLHNVGEIGFLLKRKMKIVQMVVLNYTTELEQISLTDYGKDVTIRNTGGFGSTNGGK